MRTGARSPGLSRAGSRESGIGDRVGPRARRVLRVENLNPIATGTHLIPIAISHPAGSLLPASLSGLYQLYQRVLVYSSDSTGTSAGTGDGARLVD